jgi:hypothetical protein
MRSPSTAFTARDSASKSACSLTSAPAPLTARSAQEQSVLRELTTLKRILNLARQNGKLMHVPHVPMLKERNARTGFLER